MNGLATTGKDAVLVLINRESLSAHVAGERMRCQETMGS